MSCDHVHLHRCDPDHNMARFYELRIEPELFGGWLVIRCWGRIGTEGQCQMQAHENQTSARAALQTLERAKHKRGYTPV